MDREKIDNIFSIYNEAKNKILLYLRASMQNDEQYKAMRKLILDELGLSGAEGRVRKLLEKERAGRN